MLHAGSMFVKSGGQFNNTDKQEAVPCPLNNNTDKQKAVPHPLNIKPSSVVTHPLISIQTESSVPNVFQKD